jgi:phage shock protein PspC (stress-responsive transcriptional regulator)
VFRAVRVRTVVGMNSFFDTIRNMGFRRGPQRIIGGISGGLAQNLGLNVWLVRVLVLLSFLLPVLGLGAYAIVWALTPWHDGSIPLERALGGSNRP